MQILKYTIAIDCKICNNEKAMIPTRMPKRSDFFNILGWIMIISAFTMLVAYTICFRAIAIIYQGHPLHIHALCLLGCFIVASIVILITGINFRAKKKIFKCLVCGSIIDQE
jgi:hypothetical protein